MEDFFKLVGLGVVGIGVIVLVAVLTAFPVMVMWNYLVPVVFGLPTLNFTQALVLCALCSTLFKNTSTSTKKD